MKTKKSTVVEIEIPGRKIIACERFKNLMDALIEAGIPVARSCDHEGVCGKCAVQVLEGMENISIKTSVEAACLEREKRPDHVRISCLVSVLGRVKINTGYW